MKLKIKVRYMKIFFAVARQKDTTGEVVRLDGRVENEF